MASKSIVTLLGLMGGDTPPPYTYKRGFTAREEERPF